MAGSILDIPRDEIDVEPWIDGRENEFKGMSNEQIIDQLINEAIDQSHDDDLSRSLDALNASEDPLD